MRGSSFFAVLVLIISCKLQAGLGDKVVAVYYDYTKHMPESMLVDAHDLQGAVNLMEYLAHLSEQELAWYVRALPPERFVQEREVCKQMYALVYHVYTSPDFELLKTDARLNEQRYKKVDDEMQKKLALYARVCAAFEKRAM